MFGKLDHQLQGPDGNSDGEMDDHIIVLDWVLEATVAQCGLRVY